MTPVYHLVGQSFKGYPVCGSTSLHCLKARRQAPVARPKDAIEAPASGRGSDSVTDYTGCMVAVNLTFKEENGGMNCEPGMTGDEACGMV